MSLARVEYRDFFERRGREGFAERAKAVKEKEYKNKKIKNNRRTCVELKTFIELFFFGFLFGPSFLRPLRILCALCVQKLPASSFQITRQLAGATQ
jgi:hypothetical protein